MHRLKPESISSSVFTVIINLWYSMILERCYSMTMYLSFFRTHMVL